MIKDILTAFYSVFNSKGSDGKFSLPFIVNDDGVGKIVIFKYIKENNQVIDVISLYLIDYESFDVKEYEVDDLSLLPITLKSHDFDISSFKINYEKYLAMLDDFFKNQTINSLELGKLFNMIEDVELKPLYQYFGAEFID